MNPLKKTTINVPGQNFKTKTQKKTSDRSFFTEEEIEEIKGSLTKILENKDKIDLKTLRSSVGSLETRNPFLFSIISEITSSSREASMSFEEFIDELSSKLSERETRAGTDRIYEMYLDDRNDTLNIAALTKMASKLNENISSEELQNILEQAAANKNDITREEFYNIMARRSY